MAISFQELKDLISKESLKFFEDPRESRILLGMTGMHGQYELVISLMDNGQFLQFRTLHYLACPRQHSSTPAMLKVIADLNLRLRLVKFAWDAADGEVLAYADAWIMDGKLTQKQFNRMLANFMPAIDVNRRRLRDTLETGNDPGEVTPEQAVGDLLRDESLPTTLRKMLEKLKRRKPGKDPPKEEVESI